MSSLVFDGLQGDKPDTPFGAILPKGNTASHFEISLSLSPNRGY
jgi:hypothetical protein